MTIGMAISADATGPESTCWNIARTRTVGRQSAYQHQVGAQRVSDRGLDRVRTISRKLTHHFRWAVNDTGTLPIERVVASAAGNCLARRIVKEHTIATRSTQPRRPDSHIALPSPVRTLGRPDAFQQPRRWLPYCLFNLNPIGARAWPTPAVRKNPYPKIVLQQRHKHDADFPTLGCAVCR
jgi:hypothetical protein